MSTEPFVSFVTWGRNDGYTPDYVRRVNRATNCLATQLEREGIDSEIVITEWNPAPSHPLLLDVLQVPEALRHVSVRGVIVDANFHADYGGSTERGVHSGEAANVGIRRARGRFITVKASDTFFSPEVIRKIGRRDLDPDTMYRVDRHDVAIPDPSIWNLDDDALLNALASLPSKPHEWIDQLPAWGLRELHTNACGDFTLLAAAYWRLLRGHTLDTTVLSLDIDSLVMHAAAALGVRECRWPDTCRIYKPLHDNLNNARITQVWAPWQRRLDRLLADKVSPEAAHRARVWFDYPRRKIRNIDSVIGPSIERNFVKPASDWARGALPTVTQPKNWGLGDYPLEQRVLCRADWDPSSEVAVE
jgi:hypothetical protein